MGAAGRLPGFLTLTVLAAWCLDDRRAGKSAVVSVLDPHVYAAQMQGTRGTGHPGMEKLRDVNEGGISNVNRRVGSETSVVHNARRQRVQPLSAGDHAGASGSSHRLTLQMIGSLSKPECSRVDRFGVIVRRTRTYAFAET